MILRGELADYLRTKEYVKPWEVNPRRVEGNQVKVIHAIHRRSEDDQESEEVYRSRLRTTHKLRRLSSVNTIASGSINIGFGNGDLSRVQLPHEDPLVISLLMANCMIKRVFIDPGSSANIITKAVFEQLEIPSSLIWPTSSPLLGFDGTKMDPLGVIDLSITAAKRTLKENFVLTEIHPSYNLIMGRDGKEVINLRGDQVTAKECYMLTQKEAKKNPLPRYLRVEDEAEAEKPTEESLEAVEVILGDPQKITYMDAFAWEHSDMVGIDPSVSCHSLKVDPAYKPVQQKHRRFAPERNQIIAEELNPSNCSFVVSSGQFLGHIVNKRGIECKPFFDTIRSKNKDIWGPQQQDAFNQLKRYMAKPPILSDLKPSETIVLYLPISSIATSAVLIREEGKSQYPIFYTSKTMTDTETRYNKAEKIILALVYAKRKLRHYFESHNIKVLTNYPMRVILSKPDLSGRITKWAIELSSFDISYEPKVSYKGQALSDFLLEYEDKPEEPGLFEPQWELRAEYEALLTGLWLANQLQVIGQYQPKEDRIKAYREAVEIASRGFDQINFHQIPHEENSEAD
ncbi:uncharacterized protein LOC132295960 [Cornus florida]|uniref:uncharacterized protein LOC132295960 n=1 Tax=Cornus florida TaxID=4283 RepID=UPI002898462D|nr:uncharacterized protein LOC132295960 [Cornus florida]